MVTDFVRYIRNRLWFYFVVSSLSWWCVCWIYNYLCNQCISPLMLWLQIPLMARYAQYNIIWQILSVIYGRSVVFSGYSGFLQQYSWPPRYGWNIVESDVEHHNAIPLCNKIDSQLRYILFITIFHSYVVSLCNVSLFCFGFFLRGGIFSNSKYIY